VETREAFVPANMQEIFKKRGWTKESDCPVANKIGENGFYLPSGPAISEEEQGCVVASLKEVIGKIK
jgi:perosamine synthetase